MTRRTVAAALAAFMTLCIAGCAGPHGEKPALNSAAVQPGGSNYGFSGGYVGATGGGFH